MHTVSYTDTRNGFSGLMEMAARDREPILITRNGEATVMLSSDPYASMEETLHILPPPANAEKIGQGLADYAAGKLQLGELCD